MLPDRAARGETIRARAIHERCHVALNISTIRSRPQGIDVFFFWIFPVWKQCSDINIRSFGINGSFVLNCVSSDFCTTTIGDSFDVDSRKDKNVERDSIGFTLTDTPSTEARSMPFWRSFSFEKFSHSFSNRTGRLDITLQHPNIFLIRHSPVSFLNFSYYNWRGCCWCYCCWFLLDFYSFNVS